MKNIWRDVRQGARLLARAPGFTVVALLTLALGIGANTAIFSVTYAILLKPLPYTQPDQITLVTENNLSRGWTSFSVSPANFLDWRSQTSSFSTLAAYGSRTFNYSGGGTPERLRALAGSAGFLDIFDGTPAHGRGFRPDEFEPGKDQVVILNHGFWQRAFGGRTDVVNPSTQAQALYSWVLWETGRHDDAVRAIRKVIEVEPTTAQWHSDLGWLLWSIPDSAGARAAAMRAIALDSTFYEPYHLLTWLELRVGNVEAVRAALQTARRAAGGDFWFRETLEGHLYVAAGDTAAARAVLARLKDDPRYAQRGWLLRVVGDVDGSYAAWNRAIDARDPDALYTLWSNPALYPIHAEPRYQQLLARTGVGKTTRPR